MQAELPGTFTSARMARASQECLLRLLAGTGAFAMLFAVSAVHTFVRALAYRHHLLPAASFGAVEDLLTDGGGTHLFQAIIPTSLGEHPALIVWSSLFWMSPLLAFSIGATLGPRQFLRLLLLHTSVLIVSDAVFFIVPTMPPWMADGTPRLLATSVNSTLQFDSNPTAAFPSLHVAVPFIAALWLWNHENPVCRGLGRLWMLRAALMLWAVVYTGEHYFIDGVAGITLAFGVYRFYDRLGLAQIGSVRRARPRGIGSTSSRQHGAAREAAAA